MLGYLLSPTIQIEDVNGIPLVGGKIYVYKANTTTPAVTYSDFDGNMNTNPIILDSIGHATVIADDSEMFDIEVRKADGTFLFSSKLVGVNQGGSGTVSNVTVQPGFGILVNEAIVDNVVTFTVSADTSFMATKTDLNAKQDVLIPGTYIDITDNNISVTGLMPYSAGANIDITDHVVSGKDWSNEIVAATSGKLDTSATANWDISAYSAGNNIDITNHVVSGKDWTSAINNAATANSWDVTPYSAGANIDITGHVVSGKNWTSEITSAITAEITKDPIVRGKNNTATNTRSPSTSPVANEIYGYGNNLNGYHDGIFGTNNSIDGTNDYVVGQNNTISDSTNGAPCSVCIGENNTISNAYMGGIFLIGNGLTYDNNSMNRTKIGYGNTYFEINADGTFYAVVSGTRRPYYTIINDGTVGTATNTIYII